MLTITAALSLLASCSGENQGNPSGDTGNSAENKDFKYLVDEFADLKIIRYQVPGWDNLTLKQKKYVYHLAEAAKWGRDILWDQNCKDNLKVRHLLEDIIREYDGDRECHEWQDFMVYAKRVFFSNGIHHHYAEDKIFPKCPEEYFLSLIASIGEVDEAEKLIPIIYGPDVYPVRKATDGDIVANSAVNFYEGVTRDEAESFYAAMVDTSDTTPISYGLNSRLEKKDGAIVEDVYKSGGLYGEAIDKIVAELKKASRYAESKSQKDYINTLIKYYKTGDLKLWDEYSIKWVQDTLGTVDFINGFIEDYNDPLGRKATWEANVNIKDHDASERTEIISENAQWFEDHSPVDSRFRKPVVKGVSAKVINVAMLGGDCYPATPIGINLPNADWIRRDYGSKSVTIANITHAYDFAAQEQPKSTLTEFAWDEAEVASAKKYLSITDEVHTDLHECLGHGSGQLLPGTSPNAMGEYSSTLEEARADLFGLYYMADPKLVELGVLPDMEAYKAQYANYIRNGLMVQFSRVELGRKNMEAHMQNRKLIAEWVYEHGAADKVIEKKVRDGKTYFVVNDYEALRGLFARLLAEVQRIKSEGDYAAGKALVEKYAVNIDYDLHKEVLERYASLNLKPYGGFLNPEIVPVRRCGVVVDYKIEYPDNFVDQMMEYGVKYRTL